MHGMTEGEAILWAFQTGAVQCIEMKKNKVHFETDNHEVFMVLRFQDEIQIAEELQEALTMFNAIYANHFVEEETLRVVSRVPVEQNLAAQYLANYGRDNLSAFREMPGSAGNLQHFLDRDLGLAIPFQIMDNMGLGRSD